MEDSTPTTHKLLKAFAIALLALVVAGAMLKSLSPHLPIPMMGGWWKEAVPFESLRWNADSPQVELDGQWYELVAIEKKKSSDIVAFCKWLEGDRWRKRFSEDLVQVLNRLDVWSRGPLDLTLRDLVTDETIKRRKVKVQSGWRNAIRDDRVAWPWKWTASEGSAPAVIYRGSTWELLSVDGVPGTVLPNRFSAYDNYCDYAGISPSEYVDVIVLDPTSREVHEFDGIRRAEQPEGELFP